MAKAYSTRPSQILGLTPSSWAAYQLDVAVLSLADRVEHAAREAEASAGAKASAKAVGRRVEQAVAKVLTTPEERAREHRERERRRNQRVELVWNEARTQVERVLVEEG